MKSHFAFEFKWLLHETIKSSVIGLIPPWPLHKPSWPFFFFSGESHVALQFLGLWQVTPLMFPFLQFAPWLLETGGDVLNSVDVCQIFVAYLTVQSHVFSYGSQIGHISSNIWMRIIYNYWSVIHAPQLQESIAVDTRGLLYIYSQNSYFFIDSLSLSLWIVVAIYNIFLL